MGAADPHLSTRLWPAGMPAAFLDADAAILERIFDEHVSVAAWRRAPNEDLARWLERHVPSREITVLERVDPAAPDLAAVLDAVAPDVDATPLHAFLAELVDVYAILADAERIGVRFCITRGQPCPRFHVDRVGLRLICTLRGPGTEWLDHADVDRRLLGTRDADDARSGLMRPGARIQRLEALDVALFKGESWPGNAGRGAVHRSPSPDGTWRAMVTLDAI